MKILLFVVAALAAVHGPLQARVRILTFHCNMPQFIELQKKTLDKFLQNKYELVVCNDARAPEDKCAIQNTCRQLGIRCGAIGKNGTKATP